MTIRQGGSLLLQFSIEKGSKPFRVNGVVNPRLPIGGMAKFSFEIGEKDRRKIDLMNLNLTGP